MNGISQSSLLTQDYLMWLLLRLNFISLYLKIPIVFPSCYSVYLNFSELCCGFVGVLFRLNASGLQKIMVPFKLGETMNK